MPTEVRSPIPAEHVRTDEPPVSPEEAVPHPDASLREQSSTPTLVADHHAPELVQACTRGAARSFITMSRCCVRAVYEDQLKHCANWWSRMVVVVRACFAQSAITVYQTYLWFRTKPLVGRLFRSANTA
ncbi:hypothetical protein HPB51_023695 [Rhipicephalus microplus]|uniref:Uncharacterized protein n=1 Tax=Rhipicephalus microplus TaxID=6941 RepID=A0A9J6E3Q4_RHIMP|nr:hypothetical protein HPB51_023695 [Rhipicephalus microplus]